MDKWVAHLHWAFLEEHVLLSSLVLRTSFDFIVAVLLLTFVCLFERLITFILDQHWAPQVISRSRWREALWRAALYWVATFLRLSYMLAAMTFNTGLVLVIVTSLASGQFLIELRKLRDGPPQLRDDDEARASPMHSQNSYPLNSVAGNRLARPRSKSKPDGIFIHPANSNIARADAVALQLGIGSDTERVQGNVYQGASPAWEPGEGRSKAKELLGGRSRKVKAHKAEQSFLIGESGSESESSES